MLFLEKWIYNASLIGYMQAARLAAPFSHKARLFSQGRKNWRKRLQEAFKKNTSPVAWFHCASLGEFEQGRPVIEAFRAEFPDYKILLTFFSPSGYEIRKNYQYADWVFYIPIDTPKNARDFVKIVSPKLAFFVKYEFWFHLINELYRQNIPLLSVSSIFREDQHFFTKKKLFALSSLQKVAYFFVQNALSKELLLQIGIDKVEIVGDTRFDRVKEVTHQIREIPAIEHFVGQEKVLVVGSSWKEDIEVLAEAYVKLRKDNIAVKLIIAPHQIDEKTLVYIDESFSAFATKRYSEFGGNEENNHTENVDSSSILVIDNIGMLTSIYAYADIAYVGGAFGKGLHNILEAATFGMPIVFGNKNFQKFQEAVDLTQKKGAFAIANSEELYQTLHSLLTDEYYREQINEISKDYIEQNTGATARIIDFCRKELKL